MRRRAIAHRPSLPRCASPVHVEKVIFWGLFERAVRVEEEDWVDGSYSHGQRPSSYRYRRRPVNPKNACAECAVRAYDPLLDTGEAQKYHLQIAHFVIRNRW